MENKTQNIMGRFYFFATGLFLFSLVLVGRLVYIQMAEGEHYQALAKERTVKSFVLEPSRGNIFADDASILATTVPRYELRWDAKVPSKALFEQNKLTLANRLSEILGVSEAILLRKLERAKAQHQRYFLLGKNLTYSQYQAIKALPVFRLSAYKGGLIVESKMVREHPLGKMAERTIGYEKEDREGNFLRVGLEGAFSHYLKGENGRRLKQKIANGQWKPINDSNEKEPTEGYDLHTTINVNIQDIAHHALLRQLEEFEADHGTAIVMETKTGAIKAIVNLGRTKQGKYFERLNYAVGRTYEPGSTFKLMAMIAALEDNVARPYDLIDTKKGVLNFYGKYKVRDSRKGGYGLIPLSKAFELSSNTAIVQMINQQYKKSPRKFIDRLYNMGLNQKLDLPIVGEAAPKIPYPTDANWSGITLPWMAYGYGVALTPMQVLTFYNAVANNGEMLQPKFIERIKSTDGSLEKIFNKTIINPSICSSKTLKSVQQMMFNVVDKKWGTAYNIKDKHFNIAGKTGTCQVDYTTENVEYISSFVGYFPAENPQYTSMVLVYKPNKQKGYYGATVAAPVFKEIAKKIYNATPKEVFVETDKINFTPSVIERESSILEAQKIPNLNGWTASEALVVLERLGVEVKFKGVGRVKKQSIPPGKKIDKNTSIILELS